MISFPQVRHPNEKVIIPMQQFDAHNLNLPEGSNVVLIGMPGAGKSTIGILLAKVISRSFVDTDVYIQANEGRGLQEIIDTDGLEAFRAVEERHVMALDCRDHVIATGGSVVYSDLAMNHLKTNGVVLYLELPLAVIEKRLTNIASRGVVMGPQQSLASLYEERNPLYKRYADITINCAALTHEEVLGRITEALANNRGSEF